MVGWHHRLNGHEFAQRWGAGEGPGAWCAAAHDVCQVTSILSDSLQPFGLQPSRLLCPWDSLEKKTRVGFPCLPGDLPNPGIIPLSLMSPALAAGSLPLESPGKFCAAVRGVAKSWTRLTEQQQLCQTG